jgi:hypothetical protein
MFFVYLVFNTIVKYIENLFPEMEKILNSPITADEIKSVVQKLKNGKSCWQ